MGWDAKQRPDDQRHVSKLINHSYQVFDAIAKCESLDVGAAFRIRDQTVTDYMHLAAGDG